MIKLFTDIRETLYLPMLGYCQIDIDGDKLVLMEEYPGDGLSPAILSWTNEDGEIISTIVSGYSIHTINAALITYYKAHGYM